MVSQESFKRRVRERMRSTGERYTAARQHLMTQHEPSGRRTWKSKPEVSDDAVRAATGRGWDDWCDFIEAWPGHTDGHTAIAVNGHPTKFLRSQLASKGVVTAYGLSKLDDGVKVLVAGVITHRQRPATASGVTFLNLEDETGLINIVISVGAGRDTSTRFAMQQRC